MAIFSNLEDNIVVERQKQKIKPPPMYQVVLLNDDFTPMGFVVMILQKYFRKDQKASIQIMLKVHCEGKAICGVYTRDVAMTKVKQVTTHAKQAGHPLRCVMERT
ncbi:MAG: ATP-dependent Clp protease adaptor protein ClpS [Glomeribacter sp. 1016415]|uniref:ATP-dependent Clp protease adapter protein ClpS n=1 Tax=Mycoavidus cysteinexigens TaxID=1553431 RepID=A0A2Z6EXU2_9BURK|nr:ATP-dependent Clp protease adapter ClpS [Mycoavidus cysteinexigens]MCX8566292.1 ATP-dependent Clp protease adaptor protein ClpS [Glomeribacter sp. 1016415]BBE10283.1 ATP-dependent Clp protease adaptor protein ClpS [Mycoavidus cysteinexigens]GAM53347.1 ATP-dependent Clp protease adaptor protein ClpS [bacterium endosymbiont of Mortierella elongata FMR23-6]GLR00700.1 ATP-dependent Clp protease adapter protein ClpS [Mycoavidus cysteinexigens]